MRAKRVCCTCASMLLPALFLQGQCSNVRNAMDRTSLAMLATHTVPGIPRFDAGSSEDQNVQVIEITAKKYEFLPSRVHVKQGTRVQLKITAIDRDHGFRFEVVPVGADKLARPGLEFAVPQSRNGRKLQKGKEATIEFVAKTAGTYEFKCSVGCGIGHGRMKGQLVVDP